MEKLPKIKIEEFPLIVTETYSIGSESPINQTVAPYEYDEKTSLLAHVKNPINYHSLNSNNSNTSRKRETIHNNNIAINLALNSNREKKKAYKQEDSVTINVYKPVIKKPDYYELSSERFVEGVKFVTNKAWPVTFLPLMSHDVIFYLVYPNERYGNTLAQTLLGLVPNQASITSHFGSEIMGVNYWGGILLLSTMPIIAGSINALVKPSIKQQLTAYQLERELKDINLNSRQDILKAIMPWSKLRQFLRRSKFILLKHSDEAQNLAEKKAVIAGINKFLEKHTRYEHFFLRNYALAALANYVKATANLSDIKLQETYLISCSAEQVFEKQIADQQNYKQEVSEVKNFKHKISLYQIRQKVIEQLQKTSSYYAWQANVHQARRDNLWYIPIAFARYAQAFFLWQIGFKALDTYLYWEARNACADQKNTFSYWDVTAQYECTVCDWPFVQYRNALSAQGCLDSLLSQKLNATQIADYLVQFKIPRNFSHFDLSAQSWQKWTSEEFDLVLTKAEAVLPEKIATLGIYSDETHEISPPLFHMQRLGKFLQKVQTEHIVARNENLDAELIQPILEASCNSTLKEIDLTNNSLGDESTAYLGTLVATTSVEVLIVENVGMTAVGVQKIVTTNNRLTRINLIGNDVDSTVLMLLANNTVQNQLQVIELGGRPLSADGLKQFCERIYSSPSHLNSFAIRNVPNFTDKHGNALNAYIPK